MRTIVVLWIVVLGALVNGSLSLGLGMPATVNGRIVFATDDGMASMNADGSGQWGLRFTRIGEGSPTWSSDGARIAFSFADANGRREIHAMDPDGTNVRQLTDVPYAENPSFAPDAQRLSYDDGARIFVQRLDTNAVSLLVEGTDPAWSPDGRRIAYTDRSDEGGSDVFTVDVASGRATRLTSTPGDDQMAAWSPSGDAIVFVSLRNELPKVFSMRPDGTRQARLTSGTDPVWSPDGTRLAFVRDGQIWLSRSDGSDARRVTGGNAWSASPAWQPLPRGPSACTLWGTDGNDLLVGTDGADVICGLGGEDSLIGLGGYDRLNGGDGSDWLAGGLGSDGLIGGSGDDRIDARDGELDIVAGGAGFDRVVIDRDAADSVSAVERRSESTNVAAWRPTTASNEEPTNPAALAVDGRIDDYWSSGGYPVQWIEIDLLKQRKVARLRLIAPDLPPSAPILVLGKSVAAGPYRLLHEFKGPTIFKQRLAFSPRRPWSSIRYVRLQIPVSQAPVGWVAWPEIQVDEA